MLTLTPPGFHHLNHNGTEPVGQAEKKTSHSRLLIKHYVH